MKSFKSIVVIIITLLVCSNVMAEAWGQHYAKCYIATKRYRAHTRLSVLKDDAYRQCCTPGQTCYYTCSGCSYGCYPITAWYTLLGGLDKGCSSATKSSSVNANYYYYGVYGLRRGTAYSKHQYMKATDETWTANTLTRAGACDSYVPDSAAGSASHPGFAKSLTSANPYFNNGYAHIDSIQGTLVVKDSTYYTAVYKVYIVKARFSPDDDDPEETYGCLDLDNYTIIQSGTISLNGWGVTKSGIFSGMTDVVSTTQSTDSGQIRKVNLGYVTQILSYNVLEYDTDLVSIITFSDSYYDFEAEKNSAKTDLTEESDITDKPSDRFELKATPISSTTFEVTIKTPVTEDASVLMYDMSGKLVSLLKQGEFSYEETLHLNIDTKSLQSGLYLVTYRSATRKESIKITVKN